MIKCAAVYLSQYIQWLKFLSLFSYLKKKLEEEETVLCADLIMPLLRGENMFLFEKFSFQNYNFKKQS